MVRGQREITGLPAFAAAPRPYPGLAPGPFGSKIFISERTGCYGPLPVLALHGRNGGVRRLMRLARHLAIAHQLIGLAHQKHRRKRAGGAVTRERYAVLVFERRHRCAAGRACG